MKGGQVEKRGTELAELDAQNRAVTIERAIEPPRRKLILARWLDLLLASFCGASVVLLAFAFFHRPLVDIAALPPWAFVAALCAFVSGYMRVPRQRRAAFLGLPHVTTYPPLWVAGLGGAWSIVLVVGLVPAVRESLDLPFECAVAFRHLAFAEAIGAVTILLALVAWKARVRHSTTAARSIDAQSVASSQPQLEGSFEWITTWLAEDAPIDREADDRFDHRRIAQRIAARLVKPGTPAQAVVGKLGSGKTGLRKLVARSLKRLGENNVHVVAVELWPYETSRAAVEGVVRALVDALSAEVNVVALRGLPESYVQAMSSAGGVWSAVAHLQGTPRSPFAVLEQIDAIASAIGQTYVVWVEDLERFAGRGGDSGQETLEEAERLNPIRALLHGLDRLQSVSVITATTSLHVRFDLEKIARFVEELPDLPEQEVAKILAAFRKGCRERFDVIDPASPSIRKELDELLNIERLEARRAILGTAIRSLGDALPALCPTPRFLKHALRTVLDTWTRLAGEVDIDDLLAMSFLRAAQPEVFALVRQHLDALRGRGVSRGEDQRAALEGWETDLRALQLDIRTRRAVEAIIKFVFGDDNGDNKPQGFRQSGQVDYWQRFVSLPVLSLAERDQTVLSLIQADGDEELLRLLEDSSRSDVLENFTRLVSTEQLRRLLVPLVKRRIVEDPSGWPEGEVPGLVSLWRMWLRRSERGDLKPADVLQEIRAAFEATVPRSLLVAAKIEQYFVNPGTEVHRMLDGNNTAGLVDTAREYLRALVTRTYDGRADALADALKEAPRATLLWICWGIDRVRAGAMTGAPFSGWSTLAATILDAAKSRPVELLPQVACLVSRESTQFVTGAKLAVGYAFDATAATNLFGSADVVLDLFETQDSARWAGVGPVEAVIAAVKARSAAP